MNNLAWTLIILSLVTSNILSAQSIENTVHNLSTSSPGDVRASSESQICIFCHTPHSSEKTPLWNRPDPVGPYTPYASSTAQASPGYPTGASLKCLSCHDGTIALGSVSSRQTPISFSGGVTTMPSGSKNLGTNLSDDHPVSFIYNSSLAASNGELVDPGSIAHPVSLDDNQQLQCTSCHDPHTNDNGDFLVLTTKNSQLCVACHEKTYWQSSSHNLSSASWNGSGSNPWFHTSFTTVSDNACENCHNPHSAEGEARLLNYQAEETNCLVCHNGNVASSNIEAQINKPYSHMTSNYTGIHDPTESNIVNNKHVECVDCHNPHASKSGSASASSVSGALEGVRGVDLSGSTVDPIQNEYELCFRCHAESSDKSTSATSRVVDQDNVRLEFQLTNPSYHPVAGAGKNSNVPSLIAPLNTSSTINCTDCHASDESGTSGPHGSIYPKLLKFQYETADGTPESMQAYRLCYECHDRNTIINGRGKFGRRVHRKHIVGEDVSCNVCHDPHGISDSQGNSVNNSHLINFDLSVVSADPQTGRLEFEDTGNFSGRCYLRCHGRSHSPKAY